MGLNVSYVRLTDGVYSVRHMNEFQWVIEVFKEEFAERDRASLKKFE